MQFRATSGARGERIAEWYLVSKKGFSIIKKHQTGRFGEIDIIALDKDQTVFVEVKYRSSRTAGIPEDSVGYAKLKRLHAVILSYVSKNSITNYRVDVVGVVENFVSNKVVVRHHMAVSDMFDT